MNLQLLVYSPLKEEEQSLSGWCKSTIDYIEANRNRVVRTIKGIAKNISKQNLQSADVEDIYSEILMYLYKCDDYNIEKAIDRSSSGTIVSLEGYVNSCVKYCVIRYITTAYKVDKETVREYTDRDGKELSIFDTISDSKVADFERLIYSMDQQCKMSEHIRYKYGPDIYMIWYVRLLTMSNGQEETYKDILDVLGISKKELLSIERNAYQDDIMKNFAKSISNSGIDESISILEKYVYSAQKIKEVVNCHN